MHSCSLSLDTLWLYITHTFYFTTEERARKSAKTTFQAGNTCDGVSVSTFAEAVATIQCRCSIRGSPLALSLSFSQHLVKYTNKRNSSQLTRIKEVVLLCRDDHEYQVMRFWLLVYREREQEMLLADWQRVELTKLDPYKSTYADGTKSKFDYFRVIKTQNEIW